MEYGESGDKSHCVKNVDHACQYFPGSESRIKDQDEGIESRISAKESNSSAKSHRVIQFKDQNLCR